MYTGRIIFSQVMDHLPMHTFRRCVQQYRGHYKVISFSCLDQYLCMTFAQLYRCRWQVELFFKWIKQHLRIKNFYGTSENAVKTQIWIAVSVYVLVAIIKKRLKLEASLYTILQILSVTIFERVPILQILMDSVYKTKESGVYNQLNLFD